MTINELGLYKEKIGKVLSQSKDIQQILLGDVSLLKPTELLSLLDNHINSHLFIDESIADTSTYIFYDVIMPSLRSQIKYIKVYLYIITHRDILDTYKKNGYHGNRTDVLSTIIEETLTDPKIVKDFGIGDLKLDNVDIYNSTTFYGRILTFYIDNFR